MIDHAARELLEIGARIVRHGRDVVFQLAEVAVPRAVFALPRVPKWCMVGARELAYGECGIRDLEGGSKNVNQPARVH